MTENEAFGVKINTKNPNSIIDDYIRILKCKNAFAKVKDEHLL